MSLETTFADGQLAALRCYKLAWPTPTHPTVANSAVLRARETPALPSAATPTPPPTTPQNLAQAFDAQEQGKTRLEPRRKLSTEAICTSCRKAKHYGPCERPRPIPAKQADFNMNLTGSDPSGGDSPSTSPHYQSATSADSALARARDGRPSGDQAASGLADFYRGNGINGMADEPGRMTSGLDKIAAVPKFKKDFRRSLQALLQGDHSFHGTSASGLDSILSSGHIAPGAVNHLSPMGVKEVYMGTARPPYPWARAHAPTLGVPTARVLDAPALPLYDNTYQLKPRVIPEAHWHAGNREKAENGAAIDYTVTPNTVPLQPKDMLITPGGRGTPATRNHRLRTIDSDAFADALETLHPRAKGYYRPAKLADFMRGTGGHSMHEQRGTPLNPYEERPTVKSPPVGWGDAGDQRISRAFGQIDNAADSTCIEGGAGAPATGPAVLG